MDWQNLAQQNCSKLCCGVFRTESFFLGVSCSTLGMHLPLVPAGFTLQGPSGRPVGGYSGLPLVVVHDV